MKLLDVLHRWTGGLLGLLLALLGLSGAMLVHKDAWIMLPHSDGAQIVGTEEIGATVEKIMGNPDAQGILFASKSFGLHKVGLPDDAGAYANQTGEIVTRWSSQWERPELWLFDFHHHLFAGDTGETVIGVAGIAGLFFVISGLFLWWRTRRTFKFRLWPSRMSRPAIVWQHRDLGIIVAPLLLLSIYTGLTMIFRPTTMIVLGPSAPDIVEKSLEPPPSTKEVQGDIDWRAIVRTARTRFPDAEFRTLSLPRGDTGLITVRMKQPSEWLPNGRSTLWFAADTGQLVEARDAFKQPLAMRGFNMLFPLHAARVGGLPYRLLMTISGLALALLGSLAVWTFWFRGGRKVKPH